MCCCTAASRKAEQGERSLRPQHVRAGAPTCEWPGPVWRQANHSRASLRAGMICHLRELSMHSELLHHSQAHLGGTCTFPSADSQPPSPHAPLLTLPVMAEAPNTEGTCPSLIKASNCPIPRCRWRAHSRLLLGRGVECRFRVREQWEAPSEQPLST